MTCMITILLHDVAVVLAVRSWPVLASSAHKLAVSTHFHWKSPDDRELTSAVAAVEHGGVYILCFGISTIIRPIMPICLCNA
jgi:hypothetical protein